MKKHLTVCDHRLFPDATSASKMYEKEAMKQAAQKKKEESEKAARLAMDSFKNEVGEVAARKAAERKAAEQKAAEEAAAKQEMSRTSNAIRFDRIS